MDAITIRQRNYIVSEVNKMAIKQKKSADDCTCGHGARYHANPDLHELGTSHCTAVSDDLMYCKCNHYTKKEE